LPVAVFFGERVRPLPRWLDQTRERRGFWELLATSIMRRPLAYLVGGATALALAGAPVFALQLTPGSAEGIPRLPQSVQGFDLLRRAVGPGALSPTQIVVDAGRNGRVLAPRTQAAIGRLRAGLAVDPEVAAV